MKGVVADLVGVTHGEHSSARCAKRSAVNIPVLGLSVATRVTSVPCRGKMRRQLLPDFLGNR